MGRLLARVSKNTFTDGGSTAMHSKAISGLDWMDWILLKKLVLLEHLAVLMKTQPAGTGFDSKISSLKGGRVGVGVPAVEERRKGGEIHHLNQTILRQTLISLTRCG